MNLRVDGEGAIIVSTRSESWPPGIKCSFDNFSDPMLYLDDSMHECHRARDPKLRLGMLD